VCDLETSRIGAPYIYDISSLRVNAGIIDRSPLAEGLFYSHYERVGYGCLQWTSLALLTKLKECFA
jgi:hypothetical protein